MKNLFKILIFCIVITTVLTATIRVLRYESPSAGTALYKFYELKPSTVDVLMLGSSHVFMNIDPAILYSEQGIAAFDLCAGAQPMWNSYHYLVEALKTQTPKLIVLEGLSTTYSYEYAEDVFIIVNNFGLKLSKNRIESFLASVDKKRLRNFFFEANHYHSRYSDLTEADFKDNLGKKIYDDSKGFFYSEQTSLFQRPNLSVKDEQGQLSPKTEMYYRKILELAKEKNIPIHVVVSPYYITDNDQKAFNRAKEIAKEYGVSFTDYNSMYDELNLDLKKDFYDNGHFNFRGAKKLTEHLGTLLKKSYELPDRRNIAGWESWQRNSEATLQAYEGLKLKEVNDYNEYISKLNSNSNLTMLVTVNGNYSKEYKNIESILKNLGIEKQQYFLDGTWVVNKDGIVFSNTGTDDFRKHIELGSLDAVISSKNGARDMVIGTTSHMKSGNGVTIVTYNSQTDSIVDTIGLDAQNKLVISR